MPDNDIERRTGSAHHNGVGGSPRERGRRTRDAWVQPRSRMNRPPPRNASAIRSIGAAAPRRHDATDGMCLPASCTQSSFGNASNWYRICYHTRQALVVVEYLDSRGRSPFGAWFRRLDPTAAARVALVLVRIEHGTLSSVHSAGGGVFEYRIDSGPGYRIYFGKDAGQLVVLLGGGTKRRQQAAIDAAKTAWRDYQARKETVSVKSWH